MTGFHNDAGAAGGPLLVAVLDSGVNPGHRQVGPVAGGAAVTARGGRVGLGSRWIDEIGHGTAVATTISEGLPDRDWAMLSVRVFHRRLSAKAACLAGGIRWAAAEGARIVNLSAGVPVGKDPGGEDLLRRAALDAAAKGITLVAPRASRGALLIPGALPRIPGLIAVVADEALERGRFRRRGGVLAAPPWARPLPPLPRERNFRGVSLAVAAVTNLAVRLVLSGKAAAGPGLREAVFQAAEARGGATVRSSQARTDLKAGVPDRGSSRRGTSSFASG